MKPDPARRLDVLVAGRGPVGAALALALERAGLSVAIAGPAPVVAAPTCADDWDPRVYALSTGSRELLDQLRVWDLLDASRVAPVYDMQVFSDDRVDADMLGFDAYGAGLDALAWIVEHRNLAQAFERALRFRDVPVVDAAVTAFEAQPDDVRVRFDRADAPALSARLLVGADGGRSTVRVAAGLDAPVTEYGQTAVVANFRCERVHLDTARQWFGAEGIVALLPLPTAVGADGTRQGRVSLVWSAPRELATELATLSPVALAERVRQATHGLIGAMETITPAQAFPLRRMRTAPMVAPRIALVGDAAHLVHPMAGQGMNLGFGDVADLARVLREREPGRDCGEFALLRRYARARTEPVLAMLAATDGLFHLFYKAPPLIAPLRRIGFRTLDRFDFAKRWLAQQAAR